MHCFQHIYVLWKHLSNNQIHRFFDDIFLFVRVSNMQVCIWVFSYTSTLNWIMNTLSSCRAIFLLSFKITKHPVLCDVIFWHILLIFIPVNSTICVKNVYTQSTIWLNLNYNTFRFKCFFIFISVHFVRCYNKSEKK